MKRTLRVRLVAIASVFVLVMFSGAFSASAFNLQKVEEVESFVMPDSMPEKVTDSSSTAVAYKTQTAKASEAFEAAEEDITTSEDEKATEEDAGVKDQETVTAPKESMDTATTSKTTSTTVTKTETSAPAATTTTKTEASAPAEVNIAAKQAQAQSILNSYIAKYPILQGCTIKVEVPPNPKWQGCTYYALGIIIINPNHVASLQKIIWHECEHIIDWREDQDIDHDDYWE